MKHRSKWGIYLNVLLQKCVASSFCRWFWYWNSAWNYWKIFCIASKFWGTRPDRWHLKFCKFVISMNKIHSLKLKRFVLCRLTHFDWNKINKSSDILSFCIKIWRHILIYQNIRFLKKICWIFLTFDVQFHRIFTKISSWDKFYSFYRVTRLKKNTELLSFKMFVLKKYAFLLQQK